MLFFGWLLFKQNIVLGGASTLVILIGSSALAFYTSLYLGITSKLYIWIFLPIFLFLLLSVKFLYKKSLDKSTFKQCYGNKTSISLFILLAIFIYSIRITAQIDPSSQSHAFQPLYPLYASYACSSSNFLLPNNGNLSEGFLTNSLFYYAPNSLGILIMSACAGILNPKILFSIYNATSMLCISFALSVVGMTLAKGSTKIPILLYICLLISLCMIDEDTQTYLSFFSDEMLILSMSLVFFFFVLSNKFLYPTYRPVILCMFSAFSVIGRNYGLFFLSFFLLFLLFELWNLYFRSRSFKALAQALIDNISIFFIIFALCLKEVMQIISKGISFPRTTLVDTLPYTLNTFYSGFLSTFGIAYFNSKIFFNIHSLYIFILLFLFVYTIFSKNYNEIDFRKLLKPLIFICLPLALECFTQYRKSTDFSKFYLPFFFFYFWYPAYLISESFFSDND